MFAYWKSYLMPDIYKKIKHKQKIKNLTTIGFISLLLILSLMGGIWLGVTLSS